MRTATRQPPGAARAGQALVALATARLVTSAGALPGLHAAGEPALVRSARSAAWSAPSTWEGGKVPAAHLKLPCFSSIVNGKEVASFWDIEKPRFVLVQGPTWTREVKNRPAVLVIYEPK
jgi:hypothetical protein